MSKIEHTPGPWYHSDPRTGRICIASKQMQIAVIPYLDDEAEANAALITAAPDLLQALNALLNVDCASMAGMFCKDREKVQHQARNAIAKATRIL